MKRRTSPSVKVYLSSQHDPWFNLATEDYLFHHTEEDSSVLFLWKNAPSIIIGRAQNPFLECQLRKIEEDGVLLARRQSGGGTVYHDFGNLNFTFISPMTGPNAYSKDVNFKILLKALQDLNIPAIRSPRNDLWVPYQGEMRKVSGSAFRETKTRAFHHGTLLIESDLTRLQQYLAPNLKKIEAKGVKSVRSPVINLKDIHPQLSLPLIEKSLTQAFLSYHEAALHLPPQILNLADLQSLESLAKCHETYTSWDWRFGRTLPFTVSLETEFAGKPLRLDLSLENAVIQEANFSIFPPELKGVHQALVGTRYDKTAIQQALHGSRKEIQEWLIRELF